MLLRAESILSTSKNVEEVEGERQSGIILWKVIHGSVSSPKTPGK
jgi:hypothetical protein